MKRKREIANRTITLKEKKMVPQEFIGLLRLLKRVYFGVG